MLFMSLILMENSIMTRSSRDYDSVQTGYFINTDGSLPKLR